MRRLRGTHFDERLALPAKRVVAAVVGQKVAIRVQVPKLMKLWTQAVMTSEQARKLLKQLRRAIRAAERLAESDDNGTT